MAAALRRNVLLGFSQAAYQEEVIARRLFGRVQMVLNRPAAIRHVLVENPGNYRRTAAVTRLLGPLIGGGLFLAEGDDWKEQRRTVAPAFAPRTIPLLARRVAHTADALVRRLQTGPPGPVDLLETMQHLALEIAGAAMFSLDMKECGLEMRTLLEGYAERLGRPTLLDFLLPEWIPSFRDLGRRRFRRRWLALIARIVALRQARPQHLEPTDIFDLLATDPDTGAPLAPARLADQVATMIAAGHATTAIALFWALFVTASAPSVQERIAAEVASLDLGPERAAAALPQLVYTRAVIHETLRLYPPALSIVRQARRPDNAAGVAIPRGAVVMMAPWVLHRHHRLWREPEAFDPTRFLAEAVPPARFAYLPFGAGPRVCIGAQFALTEAVLVLARMVQAFRIERADDRIVKPVAAITIRPDSSPPFVLHRRD